MEHKTRLPKSSTKRSRSNRRVVYVPKPPELKEDLSSSSGDSEDDSPPRPVKKVAVSHKGDMGPPKRTRGRGRSTRLVRPALEPTSRGSLVHHI